MSEERTKAAVAAFQKLHGNDIEALAKDLWLIRTQGRPTAPDAPGHWCDLSADKKSQLRGDIIQLVFDEDNRVRIRRMLRLPLVRELFEARDISFCRAAQLMGCKPEELRLIAKDEEWKARCPQEAHWWATGEGDASLPWDNPKTRFAYESKVDLGAFAPVETEEEDFEWAQAARRESDRKDHAGSPPSSKGAPGETQVSSGASPDTPESPTVLCQRLRGHQDGRRGFPPAEASEAYLEGHAKGRLERDEG